MSTTEGDQLAAVGAVIAAVAVPGLGRLGHLAFEAGAGEIVQEQIVGGAEQIPPAALQMAEERGAVSIYFIDTLVEPVFSPDGEVLLEQLVHGTGEKPAAMQMPLAAGGDERAHGEQCEDFGPRDLRFAVGQPLTPELAQAQFVPAAAGQQSPKTRGRSSASSESFTCRPQSATFSGPRSAAEQRDEMPAAENIFDRHFLFRRQACGGASSTKRRGLHSNKWFQAEDPLCTMEKVLSYLTAGVAETEHETFWLLAMNPKHRPILRQKLASGPLVAAQVSVQKIFLTIALAAAKAFACLRTQPSGAVYPILADGRFAFRVREMAKLCQVEFVEEAISVASRLIAEAGSIARLASWHPLDYRRLKGIGRTKGLQLAAVAEIGRRMMTTPTSPIITYDRETRILEYQRSAATSGLP